MVGGGGDARGTECRRLQRRCPRAEDERIWSQEIREEEELGEQETKLTLTDQIYLLGLKDKEGYTSFWNDSISKGLRGCILVELGLRGRISLEPGRHLDERKVKVDSRNLTGDPLLDQALKIIDEAESSEDVKTWLDYLNGETWNPLKLRYRMKHVKERVAKNLVDKGVLTTDKSDFVLFDVTTHPLCDRDLKISLLSETKNALLSDWCGDVWRTEPRVLALLMLARASDVLQPTLDSLSQDEYDLAVSRIHHLDSLDLEAAAAKSSTPDLVWAVYSTLSSLTSYLPL